MKPKQAFIRKLDVKDVAEAVSVVNESDAEAYRRIIPPRARASASLNNISTSDISKNK